MLFAVSNQQIHFITCLGDIQLIQTSTNKHFVNMLIIHEIIFEVSALYGILRNFHDVSPNTKDVLGVSNNGSGRFAGISPSLLITLRNGCPVTYLHLHDLLFLFLHYEVSPYQQLTYRTNHFAILRLSSRIDSQFSIKSFQLIIFEHQFFDSSESLANQN